MLFSTAVLFLISLVAANLALDQQPVIVKNIPRKNETVTLGSTAAFAIQLNGSDGGDIMNTQNVTCSVTLSGITRQLGNWTTGTKTPILTPAKDINDIFNHRLSVVYQRNMIDITVTNTTFADSGIYACSRQGNQQSEVDLQVVHGPTKFSRNLPDSVKLTEGSTKTFEFVLCGNPKPRVTWTLSGSTTDVQGQVIDDTHGYRPIQTTKKYSLHTYCYKYTYETPNIYRTPCNLTATYKYSGDSNPVSGQVTFSVSFKPEALTNVLTKRTDKCLQTRWVGPLSGPDHCPSTIYYQLEVQMKSKASKFYNTYSNNYEICEGASIKIADVTNIRVRYTTKFGQSDFVSTQFVTDFASTVQPVLTKAAGEAEDPSFKNISIATSGLLGVFVLLVIIFIIYYVVMNCSCCCCDGSSSEANVEEGREMESDKKKKKTTKTIEPKKKKETEPEPGSSRTLRKNRIRKENIIHKPRTLSQVTSHALVKSHTFSAYDALSNNYTDESTLQKGYMPLNTLQRRISESLQAVNAVPAKKVSAPPIFEDIFENHNIDIGEEENKRASGASAETECTSLGSRTTLDNMRGSHMSLGRTYSYESAASDYDMPYHIDIEKNRRKSIYDLPRSQTFHGGVRPNRISRVENPAMYNKQEGQYASEYALPNVTVNKNAEESNNPRLSMYSSPRKSVVFPNDLEGVDEAMDPSKRVPPKTPQPYRDDKVIYDEPARLNESHGRPRTNTFEASIISQITGLYDTPRIHQQEDEQDEEMESSQQQRSASPVLPTNIENDGERAAPPPGALDNTIGGSSENLYDNINFILTKYGCSTTATSEATVYDQLPSERPSRKGTDC